MYMYLYKVQKQDGDEKHPRRLPYFGTTAEKKDWKTNLLYFLKFSREFHFHLISQLV